MSETEKRCFKCGRALPISEFYRHPMMADGHLGKCKACTKRDVALGRRARATQYQEYDRRRYREDESRRARLAERAARLPHQQYAQKAVQAAIRRGHIARKPCIVCGARAQAHHESYDRPLDVTWLCAKHHAQRHAELARKTDHGIWRAMGVAAPMIPAHT